MNKSVATIDAPEFINLQTSDISPFIMKGGGRYVRYKRN